ncbi:hypothetical protein IWQ60_010382 [Tieghemiomyces parasiticus]|uniref:Uncharacterized protein n=1 Tax=Tieghemiomyces parasiticus TaxID=78921 RepID=A0A9W7ZQJ6_9FUNG|nr:hypothetical protein IWQ60_010382 [Tieghemiomyces parasiticus]
MYTAAYLIPLAVITVWYLVRTWRNYRQYHSSTSAADPHHFSFADLFHSLPLVPHRLYNPLSRTNHDAAGSDATGSFQADLEAGLSSAYFDLNTNIASGDGRAGLDRGEEIKHIMTSEKCGFDEARKIYHQRVMRSNNIDPNTGIPLDPKAVLFLPKGRS